MTGNCHVRCGPGEKTGDIIRDLPIGIWRNPRFRKKISTVRSRGIATTIIFQAITQMQNRYPNGLWEEILAACDTSLFLDVMTKPVRNIILKRVVFRLLKLVQNRDPKTLRITDYTPEVRQSEGEGKRYVNNPDELQRFKYKDELIFCKGFNVFRCTSLIMSFIQKQRS